MEQKSGQGFIYGQPVDTLPKGSHDNAEIEAFVRAAMRGDQDALMSLCRSIAKKVLFRTTMRLQNRMDAEDVAQDVLICVCENIRTLKAPEAFVSWLNSIIINKTKWHYAESVKQTEILDIQDYIDEKIEEDEEFIPQDFVINEEARQAIIDIIKSLPERQQEAIMLHYFEGLNVTEAAGVMKLTKQGASQYLVLARDKIRRGLESQAMAYEAISGVAFIPLGSLLPQALSQEAGQLPMMSDAVLRSVVDSGVSHANAAGAQTAKTAKGLTAKGLILLAACLVAAGVFSGNVLLKTNGPADEQPPQAGGAPAIDVAAPDNGEVVFSGGDEANTQVNPLHVSAAASDETGILTIESWQITAQDDEAVLFKGNDGDADAALAGLVKNGPDGEYIISFLMRNNTGHAYTFTRQFWVVQNIQNSP